MMKNVTKAVLALLLVVLGMLLGSTEASPTGAPTSACADLTPRHGFDAQPAETFPYLTKAEKTNLNQGESVILFLEALTSVSFKGYLLVALSSAFPERGPIGRFSLPSDGQVITCDNTNTTANAVTHTNNNLKRNVTVRWTPPDNFVGSVDFKTSYVLNISTYWVDTTAKGIVNVIGTWPSTPGVTAPPSDFSCANRDDGNYLDPNNPCSGYYYSCVGGFHYITQCPSGLVFNEEKNYCDYSNSVIGCY